MKRILRVVCTIITFSLPVAGMGGTSGSVVDTPWVYGIGGGFTNYSDMIIHDGQTVFGRLFVGREIIQKHNISIGLELGTQTGNTGRLALTSTEYFDLGNVAVEIFIKQMADLLATFSTPLYGESEIMGLFKAGIAYRQMHFDRDTLNTLRKVNPEIQAGLSTALSRNMTMSIVYQGIYSGKVNPATLNPSGVQGEGVGSVRNIPAQNGILLTIGVKA